jgi:hypothetical protein
MPLTPEANLSCVSVRGKKLLLCKWRTRQAPQPGRCSCRGHGQYRHCSLVSSLFLLRYLRWRCGVPNGQHTSSLGEAVLLLDAADPLLQDRGNLGGGGLRIGGVRADGVGERGSAGLLVRKPVSTMLSAEGDSIPPSAARPAPSTKAYCGANGIAQWQAAAMDLPTQSCPWQRLQRPGGSTGGWLLRTWLRLLKRLVW